MLIDEYISSNLNLGRIGRPAREAVNMTIVFALPSVTLATALYGVLGKIRRDPSDETRCRKCQYILKGIREPICPACGERI